MNLLDAIQFEQFIQFNEIDFNMNITFKDSVNVVKYYV